MGPLKLSVFVKLNLFWRNKTFEVMCVHTFTVGNGLPMSFPMNSHSGKAKSASGLVVCVAAVQTAQCRLLTCVCICVFVLVGSERTNSRSCLTDLLVMCGQSCRGYEALSVG